MEKVTKKILSQYLAPGRLNLATFIILTMRAVEEYSANCQEPMTGLQKVRAAQEWLPLMVDEARLEDMISFDDAEQIKSIISVIGSSTEALMSGFISISRNPEFLQLSEAVKGCCFKPKSKRVNPI